jgi:hypothetical protein
MNKQLPKAVAFIAALLFVSSAASAQAKRPRFEDFKVAVYRGKVHRPEWIKHERGNVWRDDLGKYVEPPEANFAGSYYVAGHSCGTGCRHYSLTDLRTGRELDILDAFAGGEPLPKTRDGHEYLTVLVYRRDSRLLIAQYNLDPMSFGDKCRERRFVLERGKLKPVTPTANKCEDFEAP